MNDRQREDALFRQRMRDLHDRQSRPASQARERLINGRRPMHIVERAKRGTDAWHPFASSKSLKHANSIVADGENDAVYKYRIQPIEQESGQPSGCPSRASQGGITNGVRVPFPRNRQR